MTRHLKHYIVNSSLLGILKKPLHPSRCRYGCVQIINLRLASYLNYRSSKHRCLKPGLFENLINIAGCSRLAVGTSYGNHP